MKVIERALVRIVKAADTRDGAGVKIRRAIGAAEIPELDPFLLLDEIKSDDREDYIGGFPPHPHRGFETVTYMLAGSMQHRDNGGHHGEISAGDLQWMTAGSGVIHSEMPAMDEGQLWGFQIWLNLPSQLKMRPPTYREYKSAQIPEIVMGEDTNASCIRVLAGSIDHLVWNQKHLTPGVNGAVSGIAIAPLLLDVKQSAGDSGSIPVDDHHAAVIYVYQGSLSIDGRTLSAGELGVLSSGRMINVEAKENSGWLLLAAKPLNESVARYGPFVMNTREEILQAVDDYQAGRFATKVASVESA